MQCIKCKEEREQKFFLPCPGSIDRHKECIFCMFLYHQGIANFLNKAMNNPNPDNYIKNVEDKNVDSITCIEKQLENMDQLKEELFLNYMRPVQQRRSNNLLEIDFKCAIDKECSFNSLAMERSLNGPFVLQIFKDHNCNIKNRSFSLELQEIENFNKFVEKINKKLKQVELDDANNWPIEYREISSVYKKLQNELHQLEDESVIKLWGTPCNWRRARGETNKPPQEEDLQKLIDIVKQNEYGQSLEDYINARFDTEIDSTYFQQRGYFILLSCSPEETLCNIIKQRIKIMVYASRLLKDKMFLLCYKRLNCTILRNHAWMIVLSLFVLRCKQNKGQFPLIGNVEPKDSVSQNFYNILETLNFDDILLG